MAFAVLWAFAATIDPSAGVLPLMSWLGCLLGGVGGFVYGSVSVLLAGWEWLSAEADAVMQQRLRARHDRLPASRVRP